MTVRARVSNGRLVVDEPTTLPEGTEIDLVALDDDLDDEERARLHAALEASEDDFRAGRVVDGEEVIARLQRTTRPRWSSPVAGTRRSARVAALTSCRSR